MSLINTSEVTQILTAARRRSAVWGERVTGDGKSQSVAKQLDLGMSIGVARRHNDSLTQQDQKMKLLERVHTERIGELKARWAANKRLEISKFKFKIPEISNLRTYWGSFSAVSKPNFATKAPLESSQRDLQVPHSSREPKFQIFRGFLNRFF